MLRSFSIYFTITGVKKNIRLYLGLCYIEVCSVQFCKSSHPILGGRSLKKFCIAMHYLYLKISIKYDWSLRGSFKPTKLNSCNCDN